MKVKKSTELFSALWIMDFLWKSRTFGCRIPSRELCSYAVQVRERTWCYALRTPLACHRGATFAHLARASTDSASLGDLRPALSLFLRAPLAPLSTRVTPGVFVCFKAHEKSEVPKRVLRFSGCGLSAEPELFTSANVKVRASRVPLKMSTILSS